MLHRCRKTIAEFARTDSRVVLVGSPLVSQSLAELQRDCPNRVFANRVDGDATFALVNRLAGEGRVIYLATSDTELTRRCFDRFPAAKLRVIATGRRESDFATLRALPHATLIAPADAGEMERALWATFDHPGPVYLRLAETRGESPVTDVTDPDDFLVGQAVPLRDGHDALIVTTGGALHLCLAASDLLSAAGRDVSVLHAPTVQPLDTKSLTAGVERVSLVITVEEHGIVGGLGSAVAEFLAEAVLLGGRTFRRVGLTGKGAEASMTPSTLATLVRGMLSGLSRRHLGNQRSSELWPVFDKIN